MIKQRKKHEHLLYKKSKLTFANSSSPMTLNGTIVVPNLAILTNSGWSGQNNLYILPWEVEKDNNTKKDTT